MGLWKFNCPLTFLPYIETAQVFSSTAEPLYSFNENMTSLLNISASLQLYKVLWVDLYASF